MIKRLLFCVETTRQANTDYPYINDTIEYYYEDSMKIVRRPVYMESKTRYKSRGVQEEIRRISGSAETNVIYCIDTDDCDLSQETKEQLEQIRKYCDSKGYDFIFFCRDVEDVYMGQSVPDTEKLKAIRKFRSSHRIEDIRTDCLDRKNYQRHCSNILNVLDKYYKRKK